MERRESPRRTVVCVRNDGYPASLELRKTYEAVRDESIERQGWIRVVDESGEDYLFPASYFTEMGS